MSTATNDETATSDALTEALVELRAVFPEMRLGQLICNLADAAGATEQADLWNLEDDAVLEVAQRLLEQNRNRGTQA